MDTPMKVICNFSQAVKIPNEHDDIILPSSPYPRGSNFQILDAQLDSFRMESISYMFGDLNVPLS